jgi:hypothetical protein
MEVFLNERMTLDGSEWIPYSKESFEKIVLDLAEILYLFNFHVDVAIYYSSDDMKILVSYLQKANGLVEGNYVDKINLIRALMVEIKAVDWTKAKTQRSDMVYYHQESVGAKTHDVTNTTLAESTEFKFLNKIVALINLTHSKYNESVPIHINRSSINPPPDMKMITLNAFSSKKELVSYITENRLQRVYNHNPKHGENGKNVRANNSEKVSPLECSISEATVLLKDAVSTRNKNELYVFDNSRNKFMIYKTEGQNKFHAYHPIDQDEIPEKVKLFLK